VDDAYPLLWRVVLDPPMPLAEALAGGAARRGGPAADGPAGLAPGDTFRLGDQDVHADRRAGREPDDAGGGFGLGRARCVRTEALDGAGLIQPGTLFEPPTGWICRRGRILRRWNAAEARFADAGIAGAMRATARRGCSQFVDRLGAFLVLVGLAGLAVGGVGVSAAVRAYLDGKTARDRDAQDAGRRDGRSSPSTRLQIGC
jgi:putative ABC transport system permease protein